MSGRKRWKRLGWEREKQGWEKREKERERETGMGEKDRKSEREIGRETGVGERDTGERE